MQHLLHLDLTKQDYCHTFNTVCWKTSKGLFVLAHPFVIWSIYFDWIINQFKYIRIFASDRCVDNIAVCFEATWFFQFLEP